MQDAVDVPVGKLIAPDACHIEDAAVRKRVSILDKFAVADQAVALEIVRINENETAVIPFTAEGEEISLHYCEEPEIGGYVRCNKPDCVLCRAGRKAEARTLVPVYVTTTDSIGVLPISSSLRPSALLPQLQPVFTAKKPMVVFLKKDGPGKFIVTSQELTKHVDGGEEAIDAFSKRWDAGEITLESAFQKIPNDQLKFVPAIDRMLKLKGNA